MFYGQGMLRFQMLMIILSPKAVSLKLELLQAHPRNAGCLGDFDGTETPVYTARDS